MIQKRKVITHTLRQLKDFKTRYPTYDLDQAVVVLALKI